VMAGEDVVIAAVYWSLSPPRTRAGLGRCGERHDLLGRLHRLEVSSCLREAVAVEHSSLSRAGGGRDTVYKALLSRVTLSAPQGWRSRSL